MLFAIAADLSNLGRVDYDAMPEQTLMELLVQDVKNLQRILDKAGEFLDVEKWSGVSLSEAGDITDINFTSYYDWEGGFDDDGEVDIVDVYRIGPDGSIDLRWIPRRVRSFNIASLDLRGTVDTLALPRELVRLNIAENQLSGEFAIEHLPPTLEHINIEYNFFTGSLNMASLPPAATVFRAGHSKFEGSIDLSRLPAGMKEVFIMKEKLSGSIDLTRVPSTLKNLTLTLLDISQEKLVIRPDSLESCTIKVDKERFQKIVDTNGVNVEYRLF